MEQHVGRPGSQRLLHAEPARATVSVPLPRRQVGQLACLLVWFNAKVVLAPSRPAYLLACLHALTPRLSGRNGQICHVSGVSDRLRQPQS